MDLSDSMFDLSNDMGKKKMTMMKMMTRKLLQGKGEVIKGNLFQKNQM